MANKKIANPGKKNTDIKIMADSQGLARIERKAFLFARGAYYAE